jgi:hypothetical protein
MTRVTFAQARRALKAAKQAGQAAFGPDGSSTGTKVRARKAKMSLKLERMHEDAEQIALFEWVGKYRPLVPALKWFRHIPNGEKRDKVMRVDRKTGREYWFSPTGKKLQLMGVLPGVADLELSVPRQRPAGDLGPDGSGWYHGLFIELKRRGGDKPTGPQAEFLADMEAAGYKVVVAYGYVEAWRALEDYLDLEMPFSVLPEARPRFAAYP